MRKLKEYSNFIPCEPEIGDEILGGYPFNWNVTAVSAWIEKKLNQVELSTVQVNPSSPRVDSENLDEDFVSKTDLTRPIIVRMRPESFRLIGGNHRVAKARRLGVKKLPAYYLTEMQHRQFFAFAEADQMYVDYWNDKLKMFEKGGGKRSVVGSVQL